VGRRNYLTYKGPKLDATTKSRREIELELPPGQQPAADATAMLEALGFRRVACVRKRRVHSTLRWQGKLVEVCLDDVQGLGDFVELELLATDEELAAARDAITSLAGRLELSNSERRSYLELLLAQGQGSVAAP
jgi:adenylate cyclase class 2